MQLMQLLAKSLEAGASPEQQAEALNEMEALLDGRVLTTLHQPNMAYRFRGISNSTIGDRFPDDRCSSHACPPACRIRAQRKVVAVRWCTPPCLPWSRAALFRNCLPHTREGGT